MDLVFYFFPKTVLGTKYSSKISKPFNGVLRPTKYEIIYFFSSNIHDSPLEPKPNPNNSNSLQIPVVVLSPQEIEENISKKNFYQILYLGPFLSHKKVSKILELHLVLGVILKNIKNAQLG